MRRLHPRTRAVLGTIALAGVLSACGGSSDGTSSTSASVASPASSTIAPGTSAAPSATEPVATDPPATESPVTEPPVTEPPVTSPLDVGTVVITSPRSAVGDRPTFAWESVEGAVEYSLLVTEANTGRAVWAWRGTDTSVPLGADLIEGAEGPRLVAPVLLDVFALDADGVIVAASGPTPVEP